MHVRAEREVRSYFRAGGQRAQAVVRRRRGGQPGGGVRQGGGRPGQRGHPRGPGHGGRQLRGVVQRRAVHAAVALRAVAGHQRGREGLLREHRVHQRRPGLQRGPVAGRVPRPVAARQPRRDGRRGRAVPRRQGRGRLGRQRRRLARGGGEGGGGAGGGHVREDDGDLVRLVPPRPRLALPGAGLEAGGDGRAGGGLLEHRHRGAEAGAGQRRHVLLAAAPDLRKRVGVVLPAQILWPDPGRLEVEPRPPPLAAAPLEGVRAAGLNLHGAGPQVVADLQRENIFSK